VILALSRTIDVLAVSALVFAREAGGRLELEERLRPLAQGWRTWAFVDLARRTESWGAQRRRGIGQATGG